VLALELASICHTSADRDVKTVAARTEHEGVSFLTITLPTFGKDFERSLDRGRVERDLFAGFGWQAGLPRFCGGFLARVFDRNTGILLDDPCVESVRAVRQLTLMFGKIQLDCAPHRVRKALTGYVQCEKEVLADNATLLGDPQQLRDFRRMASLLFKGTLDRVERKLILGEYLPKHGPGATADRLVGNEKYGQNAWPIRLEPYFPFLENVVPNWSLMSLREQLDGVDFLEPWRELPVKVTTVPKTLKTPRIIAIEPTAMMYMQQALLRLIVDSVADSNVLRFVLGFDDQEPNQLLAKEGSLTGNLATLDLSEASDRVSTTHVGALLHGHPYLYGAVMACRSTKAWIPGLKKTIKLRKYASMGSALTFPLEAMVFATCCFLGVEREQRSQLDPSAFRWEGEMHAGTVHRLKRVVRVFGDDIIVPGDYVESTVRTLETFGFRVNKAKSFWTGRFRESCGKEYYGGEDVSIVRVRRVFPTQLTDVSEAISMVSLRNQLYYAGYWKTVKWLDDEIRAVLKHFPTVLPSSPVLGRYSFLGYYPERFDEILHSPQVKGWKVKARIPQNALRDERALTKCLLMLERRNSDSGPQPGVDSEHLERSGRPSHVDIKLRWCSAV
jgi:hypothetical protein